ncbi:MAG: hypothetical protein HY854_05845 [Burkholderiales bacterium]|nr:hypothetical protein [Burkholderiales bacterium]
MTSTKSTRIAAAAPAPFRLSRLARACVVATGAVVVAGTAGAQTSSFVNIITAPIATSWIDPGTGFAFWITSDQYNSGPIASAIPIGSLAGTSQSGGVVTNTVTGNTITASSTANLKTNSQTMTNLTNGGAGNEGLGIGSSQTNDGQGNPMVDAVVTSSVTGASVQIIITDPAGAAPQTLTSNAIQASTMLNRMDSAITGVAPNTGYATSLAGGNASATYVSGALVSNDSQGALSVNHSQVSANSAFNAGSSATVTSNTIVLDISNPAAGSTTYSPTEPIIVTSNVISADYGGNRASATVTQDAGSGAFQGAASVVNSQVNTEDGAVGPGVATSVVDLNEITADIRNRSGVAGVTNPLTGTLNLTSNTISGSSTGNRSTQSIGFASGSTISGAGTADTTNAVSVTAGTFSSQPVADIAIANLQANTNTGLVTTNTSSIIQARTDDVTGAVNVTSNTISAGSTGNTALNNISATSVTFGALNAAVAIGSVQGNETTTITASVTGDLTQTATIGAQTGSNFPTAATTGGTVTVSSNMASATATGSANTSGVNLVTDTLSALPMAAGVATLSGGTTSSAPAAALTSASGTAGVSVTAAQANTGGATIAATVTDVVISASALDNDDDPLPAVLVPIDAGTFSVVGNGITAAAAGNQNTQSIAMSGASINTSAALASSQFNDSAVTGTVTSSLGGALGVNIIGAEVTGSSRLSVTSNTVSSSAQANSTTNTLSPIAANSLTAGPAQFGTTVAASTDGGTNGAQTSAAFSITNSQHNEGALSSLTRTDTSFAQINVGGVAGTTDSFLNVTGNAVSATTGANSATNSLALNSGLLSTSDGVAAQMGSIANLQSNQSANTDTAEAGGNFASTQAIGITLSGAYTQADLTTGGLTVTGNSLSAAATGNNATNRLTLVSGGYTPTTAAVATGTSATTALDATSTTAVEAEFSLANQQIDAITARTASATHGTSTDVGIVIGVEGAGLTGVDFAAVTVTGNTVGATVRNNNASNTLSLNGTTGLLTSSGGLLNQQFSSTPGTANVESQFRAVLDGGAGGTDTSSITVTGNTSTALAVGNSAGNQAAFNATTLAGGAAIAAGTGTASFDEGATALSTVSDFALGNVQNQTGAMSAVSTGSVRIDLRSSATAIGNTMTVTGNALNSLAQANSAANLSDLTGTTVNASAAIVNAQLASADVSATHDTIPDANSTAFAVMHDGSITGTSVVTITGNSVNVSAGQNAADNWLNVNATTVTGRGLGLNTASFVAGGLAEASTDFAVVNVQSATGGAISATALTPGDIGLRAPDIDGGTLTVTGNSINATGTINNASNIVALDKAGLPNTVNASASAGLVNGQTNAAAQTVTATVGDPTAMINVGMAPDSGTTGVTIQGGAVANITGNTLASSAAGNSASNSASAATVANMVLPTTGQTVVLLSDQTNNAGLTATTQSAAFGVNASAVGDGTTTVMTGSTVNVTGNAATATAGGNTAGNTVTVSADTMTGADPAAPTFLLTNNQAANASATGINALVTNIDAGMNATVGGGISDSTLNVLTNRMVSSAYGNAGANTMTLNIATASAPDASASVVNSQLNADAVSADTNTITAGFIGGTVGTVTNTPITVSGNNVGATATGSQVTNTLTSTVGTALTAATGLQPTYGVTTGQLNTGTVGSTVSTVTIGTTAESIDGSAINTLSNNVAATTKANDATTTVTLNAVAGDATQFSGSIVGSLAPITVVPVLTDPFPAVSAPPLATQQNTADLASSVTGIDIGVIANTSIGLTTPAPIQASGNTVGSTTGANTGTNVLNLTVGSAAGATVATPNYSIMANQENTGAVDSSVSGVRIGALLLNPAGATIDATAVNTLSNTVQSSGYGNLGNNTMELVASAGSTTMFSATLGSWQSNTNVLSSTVDTVSVGVNDLGGLGVLGGTTPTPVVVSGNAVNALGGANTANNVLNALSGAAFGAAPLGATPNYQILNFQYSTGATLVASVGNVTVGVGMGTINASPMSVLGNSVLASGYGNSAANTLAVTAPLTGASVVPTASITNSQFNSTAITATVNSAVIGVFGASFGGATTATGTSAFIVTGNSIAAQAIGNSAVNRITTK